MSAAAADVRLTLPARAEGVAVVRQALAGLADALDFDAAVLADMKMAVSEACTNVVVHAYGERDGELEVEMAVDESALLIVVRDQGKGIDRDAPRSDDVPALGLGLPLIAALSDAFELGGEPGQGTEVRMTFHYSRDGDPAEERPVKGGVGKDGRWDPDAARGTTAT
jgi:anti-sigma regulatory factor (Ser/Thr protein kinase)